MRSSASSPAMPIAPITSHHTPPHETDEPKRMKNTANSSPAEPQVFPHQGQAGQGPEVQPPHPSMDPSPYRKHDQVNSLLPVTNLRSLHQPPRLPLSSAPNFPTRDGRKEGKAKSDGWRTGSNEKTLQPASAGARTTANPITDTTPRGGIGERPASESRRLALWCLMISPTTDRYSSWSRNNDKITEMGLLLR